MTSTHGHARALTDRNAAEPLGLVALGAVRVRLLPAEDQDEATLVMQDVEGNELCLH